MADSDPLIDEYAGIIRQDRLDVARGVALAPGNPADIARARRLSRLTGIPAPVAQAEPVSAEALAARNSADSVLNYAPELAPYLSDPDNAVLARHDLPRLGAVSQLLQRAGTEPADALRARGAQTVNTNQVAGALGQPLTPERSMFARPSTEPFADIAARAHAVPPEEPINWRLDRGLAGGAAMLGDVALHTAQSAIGLVRLYTDTVISPNPLAIAARDPTFESINRQINSWSEAIQPDFAMDWQRQAYGSIESATQTLLAAMSGISIPTAFGLLQGGEAYGRYRDRGASVPAATAGSLFEGGVETATEYFELLPFFRLLHGGGVGRSLTSFVLREIGGEQVATFLEDAADAAIANPDMTYEQWRANIAPHAYDTLMQTLGTTVLLGGGGLLHRRAAPLFAALGDIGQGEAGEQMLDRLMDHAQQSDMRRLDPQSFAEFVDHRAEGTPVAHVYIPVEAVDAYLQSESADATFFQPYAEQIADARRTGGDIVVPIGEATHLAGTPAWAALREDVRVTPGGMSGREARESAKTFMQELEARGTEIATEAKVDGEAVSSASEVYTEVKNQLLGLGRTSREAEAIAQVMAARREAGGARMGQTAAQYHAANPVTFRNAAPGEKPSEFALRQKSAGDAGGAGATLAATVPAGATLEHIQQAVAETGGEVRSAVHSKGKLTLRLARPLTEPQQAHLREQGITFTQQEGKSARGQTQIFPGGESVVTLFAHANFSTLIHELGHTFLEEMLRDAASKSAPPELKADVAKVKAWFAAQGHAVKKGVVPVEAHEMFARGFERYAMEGKAPSVELRGAFSHFRAWLLKIYETVKALRAPITPSIREVFDRMLATQDQIEQNAIVPGFVDQAQANMTDAEWAAYQAAVADARADAHDDLLRKAMEAIRRRETQREKDQRATVSATVAAEVDALPEFIALHLLQTGMLPGDTEETPRRNAKLNTGWLIDTFGEEILNRLPRGLPIIKGDGLHGDAVAEAVGMSSGEQLVKALMVLRQIKDGLKASGDERSVRQKMIDEQVDLVMARRHGDILTEDQMKEEALASLNSSRQGELLATELRQLSRRPTVQTGPLPYQIVRTWAKRVIRAGRVADMVSKAAMQRYVRGFNKAQRAFSEALLAEDHAEAFKQKEAQLLNHALLAEAKIAGNEVDAIERRLRRLSRRKTMDSVDQDYLEQAQALLEQVDLKARSQISIDKQEGFEAWAAARTKEGFDVVVPESFANAIGTTHWTRLNVEDLISLDAAVKQIVALGKLKQTLTDAQGERAWKAGRDELVASAGDSGKQRKLSTALDPLRILGERVKSRIRWADAAMVKVEQMADWLDGGKSDGPWNRYLFKPLADAQGRQDDRRRAYIEKLNVLIAAIPQTEARVWDRWVDTPSLLNNLDPEQLGQPFRLTHDQIVMLAMNMGNEGNVQRLLDGYKWKEAQVWTALNQRMSEADWTFVQGVWDAVDELWPDVAELERRVNGFAPEKIEATEVHTPFGVSRGGYFPAVYDTTRSTAAALQAAQAKAGGGAFFRATTRADSTRERSAKVQRPILLDMSVITRHMNEVIHDITHREAIIQANKLLTNDAIRGAVNRALGPEYVKAMEAWLEDVAHPNIAESRIDPAITKVGRHLHRGITIQGLGYRVSTALIQPLGMANLVAQIGERDVLAGQATFTAHPFRTYKEVVERSAEMRARFSNMDASITEMYNRQGKGGLHRFGPNAFEKHAFDGILWMDLSITTGGWLGAYNKALREDMTESEAIYYADKAIRTSQGAGGTKDRSGLLRAPALIRGLYPFFSYANALYNQQRDVGRRARNIGSAKDAAEVARRAWWIMVVPPLGEALIRYALFGGQGPDDDTEESWLSFLLRQIVLGNFNSVPLVGPVVNSLGNGYSYRATSLQRVGEGVVRGGRDFAGGIQTARGDPNAHVSGSWIQNLFTTAGVFSATPLGPLVGNPLQFAHDVATGDAQPESISDWFSGVTTGRVPPPRSAGQ